MTRPAIVQGDRTVLLEVEHPEYERARDLLARFAELERSPEHVHTYRLSVLALWNAASLGVTVDEVLAGLGAVSRFEIPANVAVRARLERDPKLGPRLRRAATPGHARCPCGSELRYRDCCRAHGTA
jgi:hypothetical protein